MLCCMLAFCVRSELYLYNSIITCAMVALTDLNTLLPHHLIHPVYFLFRDVMLVLQSESNLAH